MIIIGLCEGRLELGRSLQKFTCKGLNHQGGCEGNDTGQKQK